MTGQDPEMLQMFLEEAREHLNNLEPDLLTLEEQMDQPDQELINSIFRAVHSLKGSAGFFGFENITNLSHTMESLLSLVRDGKMKPFPEMISSLLRGTDKLAAMIGDVENSDTYDISMELAEIQELQGGGKPAPKVSLEMEGKENLPEKIAKEFEVELSALQDAVNHGHFLYAVNVYTRRDIKDKGKTPLDYLHEVDKLGTLIGSYSDFSDIGGLDDIREKEISFVFLFSSVLEPDLVAIGLEVPDEQIRELKMPELKKDKPKAKPKPAPEPEPEDDEPDVVEETDTPDDEPVQPKAAASKVPSTAPKETLRVNVTLLNDLMTLAGELVLARNQLMRMAGDVAKSVPGLQNVMQDINLTTTLLQGKIMDTRMQPISLVFNKFPRLIRDLQSKLGKKIELETTGNEVDLDKSIIENLSDPLTHLVRNSADHGLETPAERKKAGKNEVGHVWLKAYHEGGKVNIDVIDDGYGIDPDKIAAKAIEKGVISEADRARMSKKDMLNLIFAPGFSTAKQVSDVSGRGVGMDVVRTNIEKLGGSVSIDSTPGEGTLVNLKLPLTLAIIPSLIVSVHEMNFAIPQVALREIVRIKLGDDASAKRSNLRIEKVNQAPVLRLRNKLLPLVYLDQVLGLTSAAAERDVVRVLVLQQDDNEFGLVVDGIYDSEEIVVKSIPRFFKNSQAYAGTTIMGDGSVALILDVAGIAQKSKLNFAGLKEQTKKLMSEDEKMKASDDKQSLLLFENAKDEYFGLNLDLIKRIEKLPMDELEKVGSKLYIEHEGKSLRVVHLEEHLPVKGVQEDADYIYVIIPNLVENPVGIIARNIIDSIEVNIKIDTQSITSKGLIGSALIDDRIVLFPDIYEIIEMAEPELAHKYRTADANKCRILLVEDTPFFRTLVSQYLESAGFMVDTAYDGLDGIKKAGTKPYDAFVVDILMPRMDGLEFVQAVRKDPNIMHTPCVALTTLSNEDTREKAKDVGFDAFEVKLHKDKLLDTLQKLLSECKDKKNKK